jgi:hypothetical protein
MSDDSIEPGIDDQLIGDFLVERTTISPFRAFYTASLGSTP